MTISSSVFPTQTQYNITHITRYSKWIPNVQHSTQAWIPDINTCFPFNAQHWVFKTQDSRLILIPNTFGNTPTQYFREYTNPIFLKIHLPNIFGNTRTQYPEYSSHNVTCQPQRSRFQQQRAFGRSSFVILAIGDLIMGPILSLQVHFSLLKLHNLSYHNPIDLISKNLMLKNQWFFAPQLLQFDEKRVYEGGVFMYQGLR